MPRILPVCIDRTSVVFGHGESSIRLCAYEPDAGEPATVQLSLSVFASGMSAMDVTATLPAAELDEVIGFLERARDRAKVTR